MKLLFGILALLFAFTFISCDGDDYYDINDYVEGNIDDSGDTTDDSDGGTNTDSALIGTWKITEFNIPEPIDFNNDGTSDPNLITETDCYANELLEISADNTAVTTTNSYLELTIDSSEPTGVSFDCIAETESMNLTWAKTNDQVSFTDTDGEVTTLTHDSSANTLTAQIPNGYIVFEEDGTTITVAQDITFVYTKQ